MSELLKIKEFEKSVLGLNQSHFSDICVFGDVNIIVASNIAAKASKQRDRGKIFGKVEYKEKSYYWCKVGLAPKLF